MVEIPYPQAEPVNAGFFHALYRGFPNSQKAKSTASGLIALHYAGSQYAIVRTYKLMQNSARRDGMVALNRAKNVQTLTW